MDYSRSSFLHENCKLTAAKKLKKSKFGNSRVPEIFPYNFIITK